MKTLPYRQAWRLFAGADSYIRPFAVPGQEEFVFSLFSLTVVFRGSIMKLRQTENLEAWEEET